MTKERLHELFKQYLNHDLSEAEALELMTYIDNRASDEELDVLLLSAWESTVEQRLFSNTESKKLISRIMTAAREHKPDHPGPQSDGEV
jgi:hypothetical protein